MSRPDIQQSTVGHDWIRAGLTFDGTGKKLKEGKPKWNVPAKSSVDGLEVQHQSAIRRVDGGDDAGDGCGDDGRAFVA